LADIHGNLPALEAVLADVERQPVDGFLVAGDITGGPQAGDTIARLCALDSLLIRGNGEEYLLDYHTGRAPASWYAGDLWANLRWSYQRLDQAALALIARLPDQRTVCLNGTAPIRVLHGTPWSSREFLYPDGDPVALDAFRRAGLLPEGHRIPRLMDLLREIEEPVLICAHSHIPWTQGSEDLLVVNPGSVGAPNNGDPRAQYALLTWQSGRWRVTLRRVAYDLDDIRSAYRETGLLAAGGVVAVAFLLGVVTGENVPGRFLASVRRLVTDAGLEPHDVVPDKLWQEAIATFDWGTGRDSILPYSRRRVSRRWSTAPQAGARP
jgi:predicted phosphodiesterase